MMRIFQQVGFNQRNKWRLGKFIQLILKTVKISKLIHLFKITKKEKLITLKINKLLSKA